MNDERLALLQMWSNDPSIMLEVIRETGMLQSRGYDVQLFLIEDGADMGFANGIRKACMDDALADNIIEGVDAMLDAGVTILICNKCHKDRILDESYGELFQGISPDSFYQYVEDYQQADVNLIFQGMTQSHIERIIDQRLKATLL